jgi:hypothetical protein
VALLTEIHIITPKTEDKIFSVGLEVVVRRPTQIFTAYPREGMIVITSKFLDVPTIAIGPV